jgi:hypothetical protein
MTITHRIIGHVRGYALTESATGLYLWHGQSTPEFNNGVPVKGKTEAGRVARAWESFPRPVRRPYPRAGDFMSVQP